MNSLLLILPLQINDKSHINVNGIRLRGFYFPTTFSLNIPLSLSFPGNTHSDDKPEDLTIWFLADVNTEYSKISEMVSDHFFRRESKIYLLYPQGKKIKIKRYKELLNELICSLYHRSLLPSYLYIEYLVFNCSSKQPQPCWATTLKKESRLEDLEN